MRLFVAMILTACIVFSGCASTSDVNTTPGIVKVMMSTSIGDISLDIFEQQAPITASNFLRYVDEGRFDSASFYRTVLLNNQPDNDIVIEVIQGGLGSFGSKRLPAISHETTSQTGLRHEDGSISMARSDPGTASSEFFICIEDQPSLDFGGMRNPDGQGFSVFGTVTQGMDIVRQIQNASHDGQRLNPTIRIHSVTRIDS